MTPHVADFIRQLNPVDTRSHGGLQAVRLARVVPAGAAAPPQHAISSLTVAVSCGAATISEVGSGEVGRLQIHNGTGTLLFGMAGELVIGGRQDRVLNSSVLIAPGATATVHVSCIEQHRWNAAGAHRNFRPARATAGTAVRAAVHGTVVHNLRHTGVPQTDQGMVWNKVSDTLHRTGTHQAAPTGALTGGLAHDGARLDAYARACTDTSRINNQLGLALFTPGTPSAGLHGFAGLDCFASPDLLHHYASRLVRGAALEALADAATEPLVAPPDATRHVLAALADQHPVVSRPAAGDAPGAQELHYTFDGIVASVLCHQGQPIHLAITPLVDNDAVSPDPAGRPDNRCRIIRAIGPQPVQGPNTNAATINPPHGRTLLRIHSPDTGSSFYPLPPGTYTIGRASDNRIQLEDPQVSRNHARLDITADGSGVLRDLGSTNGVTVNHEAILLTDLKIGDCISIGPNVQLWILRTL